MCKKTIIFAPFWRQAGHDEYAVHKRKISFRGFYQVRHYKKSKNKSNKIKVLYIIANEDITSPLLTRQVTELIASEVEMSNGLLDIKIMVFQSITSLLKRYSMFLSLKKYLKSKGIALSIIPSVTPWPIPNFGFKKTDNGYRPNGIWNRFAARAFLAYSFPLFAFEYFGNGRRIFHSRSYPPAYAVWGAQKILPKLKHVFDPRSDFPEESVTAGRWSEASKDFRFWKRIEGNLLATADKTVCINNVYVEHFKNNSVSFNHIVAPNNVDTKSFRFDANARKAHRLELGLSESDPVFVYLGGMTSQGWHQPRFYRAFFNGVLERVPDAKILFLVPSSASGMVKSSFSNVPGVIVCNPNFEDVPKWLSVGDYGLMFLHKQKIAVGTKIGEYLSVGLPIICNPNCLGTVRFLEDHPDAGVVVNLGLGDLDSKAGKIELNELGKYSNCRNKLAGLSEEIFSNETVSKKYIDVYTWLAKKKNYKYKSE